MVSHVFAGLSSLFFLTSLVPLQIHNSQKHLYRPTGQEATLTGTITIDGEVPPQRTIDMTADRICAQLNPNGKTENVVTTGDKLQNVFVFLESGASLEQYTFEQPQTPAVLQHKDCFMRPRVLGIRVNQPLVIENNDPTAHNTHPVPKINVEWNRSQKEGGEPFTTSFPRAEIFAVKDNHHPWERAWLGVFHHPFFAVSDVHGQYEIRGIPPGTYKVAMWHESLGQQLMEIKLAPGEVKSLDVVFARESQ